MRMSRRMGLLGGKLPALAEIFADMTAVAWNYNNGMSSSSNITMRYAKDTTLYYFKVASNAFLIGKIYNGTFTNLCGAGTFPTLSEYSQTQYSAVSTLRGGIVMLVSIADYDEAVVDAVFSAAQETKIYGTASSSNEVRHVAASDVTASGLYIAAFGKAYPFISISSSDDLYTPIFSYTGNSSYKDRVYLYKSGSYVYFSQTGADPSTTLYGARLSLLN